MQATASAAPPPGAEGVDAPVRILLFTKTAGFRHASIPDGVAAIQELGREHAFEVDHTEDAGNFSDESLQGYAAVVFLSTTGDVLDQGQQEAFERFISGGGGFVGIHAAADTEYDWAFFGDLVGAYFQGHPPVQEATILVEDLDHPSTAHLSQEWVRRDEWYDYRTNPRSVLPSDADAAAPPTSGGAGGDASDPPRIRILASLVESSYAGGKMGEDHPIAWCHEWAGGRSWYTGGGHTSEAFAEPDFLRHIAGGILWAAGVETGEAPAR